MFDATKLLGAFLQSQTAPSAANRLAAVGETGLQQPASGPLGAIASLLGGAGAAGGAGGLLGQLAATLQQGAGSARNEVTSNNPVAVGGLGALAGAVLGGGSGAVGGGLMAVLGSLAVHALQNVQATAQPSAIPSATIQPSAVAASSVQPAPAALPGYATPSTHDQAEAHARLLLRAMISAAKADGQIDAAEMQKIVGQLGQDDVDPATRQFVVQEMSKPADIAGLAEAVRSPEEAVQVYAASLLAIEVDTPAEQFYLSSLAQSLRLSPETVARVQGAMGLTA